MVHRHHLRCRQRWSGWLLVACFGRWSCTFSFSQRRAKVVVTDVDGTLMNSAHELPEAHREVLRECVRRDIPVVFATGKHRGPWVQQLLSQVVDGQMEASSPWTLNAPGVFVQGLRICDAGGQVVGAKILNKKVCELCYGLAEKKQWTLLAYTVAWPRNQQESR
eukprot:symbB.v1.2.035050.t1/scaffold4628.1/size54286/1